MKDNVEIKINTPFDAGKFGLPEQSVKNIESLIRRIIAGTYELALFIKYHRIIDTRDMFIFTIYAADRLNEPMKTISGISEMIYYILGRLDSKLMYVGINKSYGLSELNDFVEIHNISHLPINWSSEPQWAAQYVYLNKKLNTIKNTKIEDISGE